MVVLASGYFATACLFLAAILPVAAHISRPVGALCARDLECRSGCCDFTSGKCHEPLIDGQLYGECGRGDSRPHAVSLTNSRIPYSYQPVRRGNSPLDVAVGRSEIHERRLKLDLTLSYPSGHPPRPTDDLSIDLHLDLNGHRPSPTNSPISDFPHHPKSDKPCKRGCKPETSGGWPLPVDKWPIPGGHPSQRNKNHGRPVHLPLPSGYWPIPTGHQSHPTGSQPIPTGLPSDPPSRPSGIFDNPIIRADSTVSSAPTKTGTHDDPNYKSGSGQQYITGKCGSDDDCASNCCAYSGVMAGTCVGPVTAWELTKGCGFGDPMPNLNAIDEYKKANSLKTLYRPQNNAALGSI